MNSLTRVRSVTERLSRRIGVLAADHLFSRLVYRYGGAAYGRLTGQTEGALRKQANILSVLPDVWNGLHSYQLAYPTPDIPTKVVDIKTLLQKYDYFFTDIFGTYKDEVGLWPEAVEVLRYIHRHSNKLAIVSNTADIQLKKTLVQLKTVGINLEPCQVIMSGQLLQRIFEEQGLVGKKVLCLGKAATRAYIKQAGGIPVTDPGDVYQAIVFSLLERPLSKKWVTQIQKRTEKGIPIILGNPDKYFPRRSGVAENLALKTARNIARISGNRIIEEVGKPHLSIYQEAVKRFNPPPGSKILCLGDTLWTDIQGANNAQKYFPNLIFHSLLLLSGTERNVYMYPEMVEVHMKIEDIFPTYILPRLTFG